MPVFYLDTSRLNSTQKHDSPRNLKQKKKKKNREINSRNPLPTSKFRSHVHTHVFLNSKQSFPSLYTISNNLWLKITEEYTRGGSRTGLSRATGLSLGTAMIRWGGDRGGEAYSMDISITSLWKTSCSWRSLCTRKAVMYSPVAMNTVAKANTPAA